MSRKSFRLNGRKQTLEIECLRDGTLDCDLDTGAVFSVKNGTKTKKRLKRDADGYLGFFLNREREHKRGTPCREMRNGKARLRFRSRRYVLAHRLIKIKALAVAKGGCNWREYVCDLPPGIDVNHIGAKDDNRASMLELQTERANRNRTEMTDDEWQTLQEAF